MPTTKPQPPTKPDVKATRKDLLAYHAELQKYHEKLQKWDALLAKRHAELEEDRAEFEAMVEAEGYEPNDEEGCECTGWDASNGCECDTCEEWRKENDCPLEPEPNVIGDEVVFLKKLFELKDERK
jgi:hypothetical protein